MPRPKGSKNKKKLVSVDYDTQLAQKVEERAAMEAEAQSVHAEMDKLKARAKEIKKSETKIAREIAKLTELKAAADAEKEKAEKSKQLDAKIAALMGDGKSIDEILSALNNV